MTADARADGIDSGLDFEKALDDPSMPKMSSPTQVCFSSHNCVP